MKDKTTLELLEMVHEGYFGERYIVGRAAIAALIAREQQRQEEAKGVDANAPKLCKYEIDALLESSEALQVLIDYHYSREAEADACGYEVCSAYHERKAKQYEALKTFLEQSTTTQQEQVKDTEDDARWRELNYYKVEEQNQ